MLKKQKLEAEIQLIKTCILLINHGDSRGIEILQRNGITTKSRKLIDSALLRKETSLSYLEKQQDNQGKQQSQKFEKTLSSISRQVGYRIDQEQTSLAEWVGIVEDLRETQKAQSEALAKSKRKRK